MSKIFGELMLAPVFIALFSKHIENTPVVIHSRILQNQWY